MSTAPAPGSRDAKPPRKDSPQPRIDFDDPLDQQSSDDTDRGWGERPSSRGDSTDDLSRFLDEKPPHHL
ncbi:hypothetical protein [Streptomyces albipurpureus]|uniref:Uncharacterized protein n=1 Tax=Streptomyces albipurpureus TaxID=2897419 RepID=A0ABT0UNK1_9ACTN|nr:hypothetical protein [Streptomyces sp. CWNU-1]MCM2390030.1 hypothetical protein [Streptomyces sp. CWNU-1]